MKYLGVYGNEVLDVIIGGIVFFFFCDLKVSVDVLELLGNGFYKCCFFKSLSKKVIEKVVDFFGEFDLFKFDIFEYWWEFDEYYFVFFGGYKDVVDFYWQVFVKNFMGGIDWLIFLVNVDNDLILFFVCLFVEFCKDYFKFFLECLRSGGYVGFMLFWKFYVWLEYWVIQFVEDYLN